MCLAAWVSSHQSRRMEPFRIRIVLYKEDGCWVAHALEMDVIGVGDTQKAAADELRSNIEAQLSFAKFHKSNPLRDAPEKIQKLWRDTRLAALGFRPNAPARARRTGVLEWTPRQFRSIPTAKFQCA